MTLYYSTGKIIELVGRTDPTITSTKKLLDLKSGSNVNFEQSRFEIIVAFNSKEERNKILKLPADIGTVLSINWDFSGLNKMK